FKKKYLKENLENCQKLPFRPFTLRNPIDLEIFEDFLDRMLWLKKLSSGHFFTLFPACPLAFWDKIDDLRETSYKRERDSIEYLRCLEKCKDLSYNYSNLADSQMYEEEEFIDTYENENDE